MQRISLGFLVMFAVGTVGEFIIPANSSASHLFGETGLGVVLAAFAGAIVARRNFLIPALVVTAITWLYTVYIAYKIASVVEATSILQVASNNVAGLAVYLAAATIGAISGMWVYSRLSNSTDGGNTPLVDSE